MKLIPAYDWTIVENVLLEEDARTNYIKNTTVATSLKEVRKVLKNYSRNNISMHTRGFIDLYLDNMSLLSKTQIVNDGSYRNFVLGVRPDRIQETGCIKSGFPMYNYQEVLT